VDGTLIEAWASQKSFQKKDGGDDQPGQFRGERRSNETHESTTDPESRLARKSNGTTARLSFSLHSLMDNRNGLLVDFRVDEANGTAEREVALKMLDESLPGTKRVTLGGDKGYDTRGFVSACRERNVTPHVAKNESARRRSALDGRTSSGHGYAISQRIRKRVEEIFGWAKTVGNFRRTRYRGIARTQFAAHLVGAAYNLLRMTRLLPATA